MIPGFLLLLHKHIYELTLSDFFYLFWDINEVTHLPEDQHGPIVGQFWFLQCLMILILLSPFIYLANKKIKYCFPIILGCIYAFSLLPEYPGIHWNAFFYYSLGACFSINSVSLKTFVNRYSRFAYPMLLFFTILSFFYYKVLIINSFILLMIIFHIAYKITERGYYIPSIIVSSSFFIFAVHRYFTAIMTNIAKLCIIPTDTELAASSYYIIGSLLVIVICITLYVFMNHYLPKTTSILTGSRI